MNGFETTFSKPLMAGRGAQRRPLNTLDELKAHAVQVAAKAHDQSIEDFIDEIDSVLKTRKSVRTEGIRRDALMLRLDLTE